MGYTKPGEIRRHATAGGAAHLPPVHLAQAAACGESHEALPRQAGSCIEGEEPAGGEGGGAGEGEPAAEGQCRARRSAARGPKKVSELLGIELKRNRETD